MNPRPHPTTFVTLTPRPRERIEAEIERLIALLDALDGDADFEAANDDEPSLGWTWSFDGVPVPPAGDGGDDCELDGADDEDGGDREPSLGWRGYGRGAGRRECVEDMEGDTGNWYAHSHRAIKTVANQTNQA